MINLGAPAQKSGNQQSFSRGLCPIGAEPDVAERRKIHNLQGELAQELCLRPLQLLNRLDPFSEPALSETTNTVGGNPPKDDDFLAGIAPRSDGHLPCSDLRHITLEVEGVKAISDGTLLAFIETRTEPAVQQLEHVALYLTRQMQRDRPALHSLIADGLEVVLQYPGPGCLDGGQYVDVSSGVWAEHYINTMLYVEPKYNRERSLFAVTNGSLGIGREFIQGKVSTFFLQGTQAAHKRSGPHSGPDKDSLKRSFNSDLKGYEKKNLGLSSVAAVTLTADIDARLDAKIATTCHIIGSDRAADPAQRHAIQREVCGTPTKTHDAWMPSAQMRNVTRLSKMPRALLDGMVINRFNRTVLHLNQFRPSFLPTGPVMSIVVIPLRNTPGGGHEWSLGLCAYMLCFHLADWSINTRELSPSKATHFHEFHGKVHEILQKCPLEALEAHPMTDLVALELRKLPRLWRLIANNNDLKWNPSKNINEPKLTDKDKGLACILYLLIPAIKMSPRPTPAQNRLNNITRCLTAAADTLELIAGSIDTPFLDVISNTTQSILRCVETVKQNKGECTELMEKTHDLLNAIIVVHLKSDTGGELPPSILKHVRTSTETLHKIHAFIEAQQNGRKFTRFLRGDQASSLLKDCKIGLQRELDYFNFYLHLHATFRAKDILRPGVGNVSDSEQLQSRNT
ncbi:hypothetical protein B0H19DRAFT_1078965 [Mycena capillaripes]|nr:hypothetical protein B0H19DRAFT_1078965 [Mycena capillaripes]